jgi:hypothetical protein
MPRPEGYRFWPLSTDFASTDFAQTRQSQITLTPPVRPSYISITCSVSLIEKLMRGKHPSGPAVPDLWNIFRAFARRNTTGSTSRSGFESRGNDLKNRFPRPSGGSRNARDAKSSKLDTISIMSSWQPIEGLGRRRFRQAASGSDSTSCSKNATASNW